MAKRGAGELDMCVYVCLGVVSGTVFTERTSGARFGSVLPTVEVHEEIPCDALTTEKCV